MPSAAGKRVGRVLVGCSKPEAGDKPGLLYLARDTRLSRDHCICQQCPFFLETHPVSDVSQGTYMPTIDIEFDAITQKKVTLSRKVRNS